MTRIKQIFTDFFIRIDSFYPLNLWLIFSGRQRLPFTVLSEL